MPSRAFTISKLADAAGVNVETIRYYQRRGILAEPPRIDGGFRAYDETHLTCLQFIRRAQELGFSLDDAAELHVLSRSPDRGRLREVARTRAAAIRERIGHLSSMADALDELAATCARTGPDSPCPIAATLTRGLTDGTSAGLTLVKPSPACCPQTAVNGTTNGE
jgi:MerR family mercuric resistance operon transcriptional regulator